MAKLAIGFTWYRDEDGYRIGSADGRLIERQERAWAKVAGRGAPKFFKDPRIFAYLRTMEEQLTDGSRIPGPICRKWMPSPLIKRAGGRLIGYEPLDKFPLLFSYFASIPKNANGVLEFIHKYGPLTKDGLDPLIGENVEYLLDAARAMEMIMNPLSRFAGFNIGKLTAKFEIVDDAVRLKLDAEELLNALWLQCAQHLSNGTNLHRCQQCNTWFEVGIGTGRRLDAKFCSDEHRILFNSRRRSERVA
jgi:hypothetical protein